MFGRYLATARAAVRTAVPAAPVAPTLIHIAIPATATVATGVATTVAAVPAQQTWRVRQLHALSQRSSLTLHSATSTITSLTPNTRAVAVANRTLTTLSRQERARLEILENEADDAPHNGIAQTKYYRALIGVKPEIIVMRYESGQFANSPEADSLYEMAKSRIAEQSHAQQQYDPRAAAAAQSYAHYARPSSFAPSHPPPSYAPYGYPHQHHHMYAAPSHPPPYGYGVPPAHQQHHAPPTPSPPPPPQTNSGPELGTPSRPLYTVQSMDKTDKWLRMFTAATPLVFLGLMYYFISGSSDDKDGGVGLPGMGAGKAHREADVSMTTVRFSDVKGCDEAKHELQEIVQFLRDPEKFTKLGAKLPRGVLLLGPPGTGKTLLAKAIAGEAGVPFFFASGSEFDEMYVGVGASRIKKLFAAARKKAPCIVFIDELDAIGGRRNPRDSTHSRQAINQLLVELDGFDVNDKVIIIGATNLATVLDKALLRPGRFDRHVEVPLPDVKGRKEILELYGKKVPLAPDANLMQLARGTPGSSGAELFNLINSAALRAAQLNSKQITTAHLEWARDKILMGAERKSNVMTDESRRATAYHEGGHAIVALKTPGAHPIHKATIMPRGQALGMVSQLPETDQYSNDRHQLLARLDICMGGRVAEELILGENHVTTGVSNDLQQATRLAREMVLRYGMGNTTGLTSISDDDLSKQSEETRQRVDAEVKTLLDESYTRAKTMLRDNEKGLHRLAAALLKHETLTAQEIQIVVDGGRIDDSRLAQVELDERAARQAERDAAEKERERERERHRIAVAAGAPIVTPNPTATKPPITATPASAGGKGPVGAAVAAAGNTTPTTPGAAPAPAKKV